ncbi:MAG: 2-hydroxymuconate tautomerase [bacterium]
MPLVTIDLWEGRTVEQKREIARAVTEAVSSSMGVPKEAVWLIINDVPKTNWAIGGELASDR